MEFQIKDSRVDMKNPLHPEVGILKYKSFYILKCLMVTGRQMILIILHVHTDNEEQSTDTDDNNSYRT